ncbi:MAG TPA: hypothetical protein VK281_08835 [Xanthobacteraceae bacterium]|nr:hypothetical protein [Xanthobacteraceae bacterium]
MRRVRLPPAVTFALFAASPLEAEMSPPLMPTHDVDITYSVTRERGPPIRERVRWLASRGLERVDGPDKSTTIFDRNKGEITLLTPESRTYRKLVSAAGGPIEAEQGGQLTRGGEAEVAGLRCTEWAWAADIDETRAVCATPDGVLLRLTIGGKTMIQALSVRYGNQPPDLFDVPRGYTPALAPEGSPGP